MDLSNIKIQDQEGKDVTLLNYLTDNYLLIYFYPKDFTPGCTKEACGIRDNMTSFNRLGIKVLGVSADSAKSHKKFAEKYKLNFPLLADENKVVCKLYEVWKPKKFMGKEFLGVVRSSFLINPEGKIAKIYEQVKPEGHAQEVLTDMVNL